MSHEILIGLTAIFMLGSGAQWIAWRCRLPAILVLLAAGLVAGPVLGLITPSALVGQDLVLAVTSLSVALILFEGGLSLDRRELAGAGGVLFRLVTVGALVTWGLAAAAAGLILGLDRAMALLLGAMLVVTGPTVVGPLLRHVRPTGASASVLKWEGIVIDPVGASLALLVFQGLLAGGFMEATWLAIRGVLLTLAAGTGVGLAGGGLLWLLLRRYWVPDHLQNPVTLATVVGAFTISHSIQHESGFLAVTVMGAMLANQRAVAVRHIVEFKENIRVLLISALFILLASDLDPDALTQLGLADLLFVAALVLVVRPAAVVVSTWRSKLTWRERAFVAWMAPRGVVAAAIASVFAGRLAEAGWEGAERLVPITFTVIVGTVMLYGLSAAWVARRLGVASPSPQGLVIVGAHRLGRELAKAVQSLGLRAVLIDMNRAAVQEARLEGLDAWWGNAVSEMAFEELDFDGVGRLVALTPNDEVNLLSALHFSEVFGRGEVFRLRPSQSSRMNAEEVSQSGGGRFLFDEENDSETVLDRVAHGAAIKTTTLTETFDAEAFRAQHPRALGLLALRDGSLLVHASGAPLEPRPGDQVVFMTAP